MELPCYLIPSRPVGGPLDPLLLAGDLAMYTWGSALASKNYFGTPPPDGLSRRAQNEMAVHLLHEVRQGPAFHLVRESQSSDLVIDAARRLVSHESLTRAADTVLERIIRLPEEVTEAVFTLMNLWGGADSLGFQIARGATPKSAQARSNYWRGLLTYDDFCFVVFGEARDLLDRLLEALRLPPRGPESYTLGVSFSEFGLGFYPHPRIPVSRWHGVPVYEVSWHYGYVPHMGSATQKQFVSWSKRSYIDICPPAIEREASWIVFPVVAEHRAPLVAAALGRLSERIRADAAEQIGPVSAALTDMVLWHEIGHIWSMQWIRKAASVAGYREEESVRWTTIKEFYAECRAIRQILHTCGGLPRDVFLLHVLRDVEPEKNLAPQLPSYRWPIARALAREDGISYLTSLERTLRRMLNGVPLTSIERWFDRQAEEAIADLKAELVG